jgi:hypothetical protein
LADAIGAEQARGVPVAVPGDDVPERGADEQVRGSTSVRVARPSRSRSWKASSRVDENAVSNAPTRAGSTGAAKAGSDDGSPTRMRSRHARSSSASVRIETFYTPANLIAALLNRLMMRRRFGAVVDALLAGLRTTAEQRHNVSTLPSSDQSGQHAKHWKSAT